MSNGLFSNEAKLQQAKSFVIDYLKSAHGKSYNDQVIDLTNALKTSLTYRVQFYVNHYVMRCSLGPSTVSKTFTQKWAGLNECSHSEMINLLKLVCGVTPLKSSQGNEVRHAYDEQSIPAPVARKENSISASRQNSEENSTLTQIINIEQESKPFSAFGKSRTENITIQTQTEFRDEEISNDVQKNIITMKRQIAYLLEENERNRTNENTLLQMLEEKIKDIEKLTTANKHLTDVSDSLKRKIQVFEQKLAELESHQTDQSTYDKISPIMVQTQLHRFEVEKYDAFRMNNIQRDVNNLRTELIKTNSQTEKCQSKIEKFQRKYSEQKIRLQTVERNVTDYGARLDRTEYGLTNGRHGTIRHDNTRDMLPPPPQLTGHYYVAPSSSQPPPPPPPSLSSSSSPPTRSSPPPPPPPPPPSSSSSPPPPPPLKSSPVPPPPPNTAKGQTRTATDVTPPRMLITCEMLRSVKLKPANERRLCRQ